MYDNLTDTAHAVFVDGVTSEEAVTLSGGYPEAVFFTEDGNIYKDGVNYTWFKGIETGTDHDVRMADGTLIGLVRTPDGQVSLQAKADLTGMTVTGAYGCTFDGQRYIHNDWSLTGDTADGFLAAEANNLFCVVLRVTGTGTLAGQSAVYAECDGSYIRPVTQYASADGTCMTVFRNIASYGPTVIKFTSVYDPSVKASATIHGSLKTERLETDMPAYPLYDTDMAHMDVTAYPASAEPIRYYVDGVNKGQAAQDADGRASLDIPATGLAGRDVPVRLTCGDAEYTAYMHVMRHINYADSLSLTLTDTGLTYGADCPYSLKFGGSKVSLIGVMTSADGLTVTEGIRFRIYGDGLTVQDLTADKDGWYHTDGTANIPDTAYKRTCTGPFTAVSGNRGGICTIVAQTAVSATEWGREAYFCVNIPCEKFTMDEAPSIYTDRMTRLVLKDLSPEGCTDVPVITDAAGCLRKFGNNYYAAYGYTTDSAGVRTLYIDVSLSTEYKSGSGFTVTVGNASAHAVPASVTPSVQAVTVTADDLTDTAGNTVTSLTAGNTYTLSGSLTSASGKTVNDSFQKSDVIPYIWTVRREDGWWNIEHMKLGSPVYADGAWTVTFTCMKAGTYTFYAAAGQSSGYPLTASYGPVTVTDAASSQATEPVMDTVAVQAYIGLPPRREICVPDSVTPEQDYIYRLIPYTSSADIIWNISDATDPSKLTVETKDAYRTLHAYAAGTYRLTALVASGTSYVSSSCTVTAVPEMKVTDFSLPLTVSLYAETESKSTPVDNTLTLPEGGHMWMYASVKGHDGAVYRECAGCISLTYTVLTGTDVMGADTSGYLTGLKTGSAKLAVTAYPMKDGVRGNMALWTRTVDVYVKGTVTEFTFDCSAMLNTDDPEASGIWDDETVDLSQFLTVTPASMKEYASYSHDGTAGAYAVPVSGSTECKVTASLDAEHTVIPYTKSVTVPVKKAPAYTPSCTCKCEGGRFISNDVIWLPAGIYGPGLRVTIDAGALTDGTAVFDPVKLTCGIDGRYGYRLTGTCTGRPSGTAAVTFTWQSPYAMKEHTTRGTVMFI